MSAKAEAAAPTIALPLEEARKAEPGALRRLWRNRSGAVGLVLVTLFVLVGLLGLLEITPYPVREQFRTHRLEEPSAAFLLGTDLQGRDMTSRLMKGAANSLQVAVFSVTFATLIGTLIGTVAGYVGGGVDNATMRVMDVFFAFPGILLALLIVTALGQGLTNTMLAIGIVYTPIFARVARGPVLSVKNTEFVVAARCLGMSHTRILFRHILPNTLAPLIVQVTLALSWSLITEAGLSFLGLGITPPEPSWGVMLDESRGIAENAPWLMIYPAVAIMLVVLGFNLLGDGLRDVLDPRLRGRR